MAEHSPGSIVRGGRAVTRAGRVVALTGAQTFLGRNIVGVLEEDESIERIVVLDTANVSTARGKTRYYALDRTQPDASARIAEILAAERVTTFAHLGFLELPVRETAWAHELESVGTLHILNACREHNVDKLVLASSTALYGPNPDNPNFLDETHPLRGIGHAPFLADKIDAERQVAAFAAEKRSSTVTVLRFAPLLGPTAQSHASVWLSRPWVPTLLGYDPLVQFVHESDALRALELAIGRDAHGVFNIVADGVLPASLVVRLAGRRSVPLPYFLAKRLAALFWLTGQAPVPHYYLRFLRYLCVADGARAKQQLGFAPSYTSREAVLDFGAVLRLREARLLTEEAFV